MAEGETDGVRVLFWGTPSFAVPSLRALIGEGHDVVGIVTQPDRPAGRGRALTAPPVKQVALEEAIPVLQPERARGEEFREQLRRLDPEISVVVAYGQILKNEILELPPRGSINVHASLLPELRGAAPINWAIVRGHRETGVTIMRMVEKMDAGPIILQVAEPIADDERADDLWSRLSEIGAATLIEALALIESGTHTETPQDESRATYAPRITRADAQVDWSADAVMVDRLIRGMDSVPGAWTRYRDADLKVFRPKPEPDLAHGATPGTVLHTHASAVEEGMLVACGSGAVWIREVQPQGKRRLTTAEWLRGRGAREGDVLG